MMDSPCWRRLSWYLYVVLLYTALSVTLPADFFLDVLAKRGLDGRLWTVVIILFVLFAYTSLLSLLWVGTTTTTTTTTTTFFSVEIVLHISFGAPMTEVLITACKSFLALLLTVLHLMFSLVFRAFANPGLTLSLATVIVALRQRSPFS